MNGNARLSILMYYEWFNDNNSDNSFSVQNSISQCYIEAIEYMF